MLKFKLITLLIFLTINCIGQLPQIITPDNQIIQHKGYILSYNETCEQANWIKYRITKADLQKGEIKRKDDFREDPSIPTKSATLNDYKGANYDRGHLAPAASFTYSEELMSESFFLSNMSPQVSSFNRGIWKKLETYERELVKEKDTLYIITGGILNAKLPTIGENKVCVPEFYFKIIYNKSFQVGYILKNEASKDELYMFKQPIKVIEEMTGMKFFLE